MAINIALFNVKEINWCSMFIIECGNPPEFNSKTDTNRNYKIISSKIFTNIFIVKKIISIALHFNIGIYYLENIPWMWFMTFRALFILTNWAVVWGGERNYLVSILLNNQMDNYEMIRFTDNKILFFIVIKIMILSSTLYVIVLL